MHLQRMYHYSPNSNEFGIFPFSIFPSRQKLRKTWEKLIINLRNYLLNYQLFSFVPVLDIAKPILINNLFEYTK